MIGKVWTDSSLIRASIQLNDNCPNYIKLPMRNNIRMSLWFNGWTFNGREGSTPSEFHFDCIIDTLHFSYEVEIMYVHNFEILLNKNDTFYFGSYNDPVGHGIVLENLGLVERKKAY